MVAASPPTLKPTRAAARPGGSTGTRLLGLAGALCLCLASATAGGRHDPDDDDGNSREIAGKDLVGWRVELDTDTRVVHALGIGADRASCTVERPSPDRVIARCTEGVIAIMQEKRTLLIGCDKISRDVCRTLFDRILEHTPIANADDEVFAPPP